MGLTENYRQIMKKTDRLLSSFIGLWNSFGDVWSNPSRFRFMDVSSFKAPKEEKLQILLEEIRDGFLPYIERFSAAKDEFLSSLANFCIHEEEALRDNNAETIAHLLQERKFLEKRMGSFIERKIREADESPEDFISQEYQERFQKDIEDLIKKYEEEKISLKKFAVYMVYQGTSALFTHDGTEAVSELFEHIESSLGKEESRVS